jgi:translation initiation factor 2 subunit 3
MALKISGIKNVVICQNKIDVVNKTQAMNNYKQIKDFIKGTDYEDAPIIPISAQQKVNIDLLIEAIEDNIPTPRRDQTKEPLMYIARSFDINKPGVNPEKIVGGVLGGALKQGILKVGEEIEIRPGICFEEKNQKVWKPLRTKIVSLKTGGQNVDEVSPGGSIGVLTSLDPSIVKGDSLVGNVAGRPEKLPPVWKQLKLEIHLLERVVGVKQELVVEAIKPNEPLMLNVNSSSTVGIVSEIKKGYIKCMLKLPVCAELGSSVTVSRMIVNRFRLIGYGIIKE